jgi:restriction endonuclease S subunit
MHQRSSGGNYPAITEEELKRILIPVPDEKTQSEIVDELRSRRMEARRLREEAAREWDEAKANFEARLLGG